MGYISILLLSFFISLGFSIFIIPRILLISFKKHLFDMPDERKVHKGIIPRLGGVSFFPAVIFTLSLMIGLNRIYGEELFPSIIGVSDTSVLSFGLSSLLLLYLTGITDDLIGVRYRQKFIVQIFCAILLVSSGLWINNLYGIFGIYELPPVVGLPFTVFTIVFITNAINLIDGIPLPDQHPLHTIIVMLFIRYRCSDIKFLMLPDRMYNIVYSPQLFLLFLQLLIQLLFMCHKQLLQTFFTAAMQQLLNLFQRKPKYTIIADTFQPQYIFFIIHSISLYPFRMQESFFLIQTNRFSA